MSFISGKKVGGNVYYYEVENKRVDGKVVQKYISMSVRMGKDGDGPSGIPLEKVQFEYIATRLMQGDLSADDLMDMIEGMCHHVDREPGKDRIAL